MLLKLLVSCGLFWGIAQVALAEEGILDHPGQAVSVLKTVIDTLSPQTDTLWNFYDLNDDGGEWLRGVSVGILTLKSQSIPLASWRLGYIGEDGNFSDARGWYAGANLDLPGLTKRYVPSTVKGIATKGYLDALWKLAGRYGRIGINGGYDADRETPIVAASAGVSVSW